MATNIILDKIAAQEAHIRLLQAIKANPGNIDVYLSKAQGQLIELQASYAQEQAADVAAHLNAVNARRAQDSAEAAFGAAVEQAAASVAAAIDAERANVERAQLLMAYGHGDFEKCEQAGYHRLAQRHNRFDCQKVNPSLTRVCNVCGDNVHKSEQLGEWVHSATGLTAGYAVRPHHAFPEANPQ